jgi:hypothetical protein
VKAEANDVRKQICLMIALGAMAFGGLVVGAQKAKWADAKDQTAQTLIEMERRWEEADCDGNLLAETTLADDFQGTAPDGSRYQKADDVQETKSAKQRAHDCRLGEVKVHYFGENLAVLYGSESRVEKGKDGQEKTLGLIWTDTWLKRNGKGQVIAAQDSWAEKK